MKILAFLGWMMVSVAEVAAAELLGPRPDLTEADRARVAVVIGPTTDFRSVEPFESLPGGAATNRAAADRDSFSQADPRLSPPDRDRFALGSALFRKIWVSSPSSTRASDGLGPLYNARSCEECHRRDGRGSPATGEAGLILHLARPAADGTERSDPDYGRQLQDRSLPALPAEGQLSVSYADRAITLADGTVVTLSVPVYGIIDPAYGPLSPDLILSPRLAPPMIGLGLVEAIDPGDILALADPDDRDSDGISGKAVMQPDRVSGEPRLGRFGWKAMATSLEEQAALAFSSDMGLSTGLFPEASGDCTPAESRCLALPNGVDLTDHEVDPAVLDLIHYYNRMLAPPVRRNAAGPAVLAGKALFYDIGCTACHRPKYVTSRKTDDPVLSFQLIWPYSDFLTHDMGPELADQGASHTDAREWRTPPLWGLGLTPVINDSESYLHDGRARSLPEAILWHGGEGQTARDRFAALNATSRAHLIDFLKSL